MGWSPAARAAAASARKAKHPTGRSGIKLPKGSSTSPSSPKKPPSTPAAPKIKLSDLPTSGRQTGSKVIKKKFAVMHNGAKVGELHYLQHRIRVPAAGMSRITAGYKNDFAEYKYLHGQGAFPKSVKHAQSFTKTEGLAAARKHIAVNLN